MSEVLGYLDLSPQAGRTTAARTARAAHPPTPPASRGRTMACGIVVALGSFILAGCPSFGPKAPPPPTVDRADTLARQGDHAGAARLYEELAGQNTGADRANLQLRAA